MIDIIHLEKNFTKFKQFVPFVCFCFFFFSKQFPGGIYVHKVHFLFSIFLSQWIILLICMMWVLKHTKLICMAFKTKLPAEVPLNTGAVPCAPPTGGMSICVTIEVPVVQFFHILVVMKYHNYMKRNECDYSCLRLLFNVWFLYYCVFCQWCVKFLYIWSWCVCMRVPCDQAIGLDIPVTSTYKKKNFPS